MDRDSASIVLAYCGAHPCSGEIAKHRGKGEWKRRGSVLECFDHDRTWTTFWPCGCTINASGQGLTRPCWLHKYINFGNDVRNEWSIAITALAYRIAGGRTAFRRVVRVDEEISNQLHSACLSYCRLV
jgi:hypothetical protein